MDYDNGFSGGRYGDQYGDQQYQDGRGDNDNESNTGLYIGLSCSLLLVSGGIAGYFYWKSKKQDTGDAATGDGEVADLSTGAPFIETVTTDAPEKKKPAAKKDAKTGDFGFENLGQRGYFPNALAQLRPSRAGKYELVACNGGKSAGGKGVVAIRFNKQYLAAGKTPLVSWVKTRKEPDTCWQVVYNKCGSNGFVMLKSVKTGRYLQADYNSLSAKAQSIGAGSKAASSACWSSDPSSKKASKTSKTSKKKTSSPANLVKSSIALTNQLFTGQSLGAAANGLSSDTSLFVGGQRAKLVACAKGGGAGKYVIQDFIGRQLQDSGAGTIFWGTSIGKGGSCWAVGKCTDSRFVTLKSVATGLFIQASANGGAVSLGPASSNGIPTPAMCWMR